MLIKQAVTYNTIPDYPINYSYENFYDGTMLIRRTDRALTHGSIMTNPARRWE